MNIHEHQAKTLLSRFKAPVLKGAVAYTAAEAVRAAESLGGKAWVVKAQIHAGGRGKAGGVKVVKTLPEVKAAAEAMLGLALVTPQTGKQGKVVRRLYVEEACRIAKEYYASFLLDRASGRIAIVASAEGGMEIEEVAEKHPEKILNLAIDPATGLMPFHARRFAFFLGLSGETANQAMAALQNLYEAFVALDASLIEINPLAVTEEGKVVLLDAKMSFDDNALFRHPEIARLRDESEEDPAEAEAKKHGLSYVKLTGNIGCMVNGAGLAMATMDIIKLKGGEPANFLDVGGGASREKVTEAFRILLSDQGVKGVLVNIFGGIMKCDIIAEGIIAAAKLAAIQVPLVVRLAGTNVEKGKALLENSNLPIIPADDLDDAAEKIVAALGTGK